MSQINVNTITDEAGTGPVNFPYDFTIAGSALVIPPAHNPVSVSGATQALDVGSYNFFNGGDLTVDVAVSFTNVPTNALWTYTAKAGLEESHTLTNNPVYSGNRVAVRDQDSSPNGVAFSSDGTKMYIMGNTNARVYQYTLSIAWNVGSATYDSVSFSVSAQEIAATDLTFSTDGTKMYVIGTDNDTVYQYTLSTAWDLSTASYASLSKSVTAQDTVPTAIAFSTDGTKMYMLGDTGNSVYQYTLGTAWNVSTATYASLSLSVISETSTGLGIAFSTDGTKLYVVAANTENVYQYNNTSIAKTITVPAAVQNPSTTTFYPYDQISYTFVTNDGGTTVRLINEAVI
jgi:sugar lactone lactonase YvrE